MNFSTSISRVVRKSGFTGLVGMVALSSLAAHGASSPTTALSPFAVTVNGEVLPPQRGELLLQQELSRGVKNTPQLQTTLRDVVINQALMAQEAVKGGLDKGDNVAAELDQARQGVLVRAWEQHELQGMKIADADLKDEYQKQVQALGKESVQLRHVLVSDEKVAQQILEKLQAGANFEAVAKEYSGDAATRERGGLSDWLPMGRLDPVVSRSIQEVKAGQLVAAPVKTAAGWQILRLEGRRPYAAPAMNDVLPQLRLAIAQRYLQERLKGLRNSAKIESPKQ